MSDTRASAAVQQCSKDKVLTYRLYAVLEKRFISVLRRVSIYIYPVIRTIGVVHTACKNMSFNKIFDLTAGGVCLYCFLKYVRY